MAIVSLPLPIQLINGNVADGGQVMTDLNAIASNVNANAAKNGVNSDITSLTALISIAAGLTITGATITASTYNGGTIVGTSIDATTTVPTAGPGTNTTQIASTAFVTATALSAVLPGISAPVTDYLISNNGSIALWSNLLKTGTINFADSSDATKKLALNISGFSTATTRTLTVANRDSNIGSLPLSSRTSNTILAGADFGSFVDITSGTFSQTFTAAATLGAGWWCFLRNSGSGDSTLDPNGAELIDGLTSYIMYPGEIRLIQCNGTAFTTILIHAFNKTFTTSGTFTTPPGYSNFGGLGWSAGSSGQRTNNNSVATIGGAGGGCFPYLIPVAKMGSSQTITIGAGGAAVSGVANGNAGGDTSIGALIVIKGAAWSVPGAISGFQGVITNLADGFGSTITNATPGASVYGGGSASNNASVDGAALLYGGGCGGSYDGSASVRAPGTSIYGGNGGAGSMASNGTAGTAPGGAGGGTCTGTNSGAGARGELRIWGIA